MPNKIILNAMIRVLGYFNNLQHTIHHQECHGEGERVDPKLRCKKCNGRKVNRERKILEVQVDKGMADGQKITFTSEGDQEPGLEPGDIIIVLDEKAHERFKRSDQDLIMKMDISLTEALTGMKKTIKTLDDRTLVIQTVRGMNTYILLVSGFQGSFAGILLNSFIIFYNIHLLYRGSHQNR